MRYSLIILILIGSLLSSCGREEVISDTPIRTGTQTILALGDSLTAGYGLPIEASYPSQLEARLTTLGYHYTIQNAGVSWDTTAALLARLDWVLDWPTPSLIILCVGANDAFQGKSVADIEAWLRAIIEKIQAKKIPILLAGMKAPFNLGQAYMEDYDALFPKLAKEYHLSFMPFFLSGVALKANLNQDDRIHPTREGYAIVVENLVKVLEKEKLVRK